MREIMGKKPTIGKACAMCSVLDRAFWAKHTVPLEEAGHEDSLRVFKEAAYYALTDKELEDILNTEDAAL